MVAQGNAVSTGPNAAYEDNWVFTGNPNLYQDEANVDNSGVNPQGPTTNAAGTQGHIRTRPERALSR